MAAATEIEPLDSMTAADALAGEQVAAQTILQRTVCLVLRCGYVGNARRVSLNGLDLEKDGEKLDERAKATKRMQEQLVPRRELREAAKAVDAVKDYLSSRAVGGRGVFGPGTYLLPLLGLPETLERARQLRENVGAAAGLLAGRWTAVVAARLSQPGTLLAADDFPSAADVRAAFSVAWTFVSFTAPERLAEVDAAAYEAARAESRALLAGALADVVAGLRAASLRVLEELAERLGPGPDGEPRVLRGTALRDLQALVDNLPSLNSVGRDAALDAALARVRAVSQGVDVETLRKAPAVRDLLRQAASEAAAAIAELGVAEPRAFAFGGIPQED